MISEQNIRLIENYLFGKLSEHEIIAFEQRIKNDKEFADEVNFMRDLMIGSAELGKNELRNKLKIIAHDYKTNESQQKNNFKTYLAIAASVIALVGISAILYFMQSPNGKDANNIADLQNDTINEVNKIIANSSTNTKFYNVNQPDGGFGFAEADSLSTKLPVLTVTSSKYQNNYLYRDTLFLFLPSEDSLRFCSFPEQSNLLYFEQGKGNIYFIELKKGKKLGLIMPVDDKEVMNKIKKGFDKKN